jgi:glycopeptide antibiotics resistance protein
MRKNHQKIIAIIVAVFLIVLFLFFGLRPKTWPGNNGVSWLPEEKALRFKPPGIAYVDDFSFSHVETLFTEFSFHVTVSPERLSFLGFKPILLVHAGDDSKQLSVWHWGPSLIVMNGDDYDYTRKLPRIFGENVLTTSKQSFISVTSGSHGSHLYIDGEEVASSKEMRLKLPETSGKRRLVLGNSVRGDQGWEGDLFAFGLYGKAFSQAEIKNHFQTWKKSGKLPQSQFDNLQLLYNFENVKGAQVMEASGKGPPLFIPSKPLVLQKAFLVVPGRDIEMNSLFAIDVFLNLAGFVLLGAVLYHCLIQFDLPFSTYLPWVVLLFCFLLSLSLEILQTSLPTRVSSLLDLILNTLGGWLGAKLYAMLLPLSASKKG